MFSFIASIALLVCATLLTGWYGLRRYRTLLNPLSVFAGFEIGLITLLSAWVTYSKLDTAPYTVSDMAMTAYITLAQVAGFFLAFRLSGSLPARLFGKAVYALGLSSENFARRYNIVKFGLLLLAALGAFAALAISGGGGWRWLTDTRATYIQNRAGAGLFFAAYQWFVTLALLYYLWARRPRSLRLALVLCLFAGLAYFSGSKNNIMILFIACIAYYHFKIKPLSFKTILLLGVLVFAGFLALLSLQSPNLAELFGSPMAYFRDYFDTTTRFLARFDEFGFRYGAASLSNFWFFVPRSLYPDKPYEYGLTLIHEVLFPHMAETGNTPGLLSWSLNYLDFGTPGVFLFGFANGLWKKASYDYYLAHRDSFFAFVFMMQFSLWAVLTFAPLLIVLVLNIALSIFFRLTLRFGPKWHKLQQPAEREVASMR